VSGTSKSRRQDDDDVEARAYGRAASTPDARTDEPTAPAKPGAAKDDVASYSLEPSPSIQTFDSNGRSVADAGWLSVCAWCDRVRIGDHWLDPERAGVSVHRFCLTHGICPACLEVALRHLPGRDAA
jgi:hypothetical protein